jgi:hypothetical protein
MTTMHAPPTHAIRQQGACSPRLYATITTHVQPTRVIRQQAAVTRRSAAMTIICAPSIRAIL